MLVISSVLIVYLCLGGETCGQMNDPACGIAGVDVLTSGSARPHELELQLRLGNLELLVVRGFGQNGDTACTGKKSILSIINRKRNNFQKTK